MSTSDYIGKSLTTQEGAGGFSRPQLLEMTRPWALESKKALYGLQYASFTRSRFREGYSFAGKAATKENGIG